MSNNMKKIILTAAAAATIASSTAMAAFENISDSLYVKANAGVTNFNIKHGKKNSDTSTGLASVAMGYYIMDNVRADISLDHTFSPKFKGQSNDIKLSTKFDSNSLLLNAYMDVADLGMAKMFVGAGAGMTRIKAEITETNTSANTSEKTKLKADNVLTVAGYVGFAAEVEKGIFVEAMYQYKHTNKIKSLTVNNTKTRLQSHTGTVGIRFDI